MNPYWLEDDEPPRAAPAHAGRVDVAIVGAGITGCSAAWRLAQAGLTVRVHDQRGVAEGASGRNGGFALRGGASRYDIARETYGREQASELWHWTEHALDRMAELAGDSLRRTGSLRLAADADERDEIRGEFDAMREDGIAAEWIDEPVVGLEATAAKPPPPGRRIAGSPSAPRLGRFHGAIHHTEDGALQPARFVRRLAARAADAGVEIREHDRVGDVATLDAEHVVVATDGYGHGLVPELADLVWPTRGQVIVSAPLDRVLYDKPHYARQGFDYWQQLPDGRLLLGGFRDVSIMDELTDVEETTPTIQASLERFMGELIGEAPAITHRWAGIFGLTQDMLPLVGRVPGHDNVWVAGGYSGHGNVLGFACGELVADAIRGDTSSPQLRLFDPARFF